MSKYNNKPRMVDGHRFDSIAEARRYDELKLMEQADAIRGLTLQPIYSLQPRFRGRDGKMYRAITYVGDFQYWERGGQLVVEDVKGVETQVFQIKRKLFVYLYPNVELRIVKQA